MPTIVSREVGTCEIDDLRTRPLGPTDVLVRIDASGICHSDLSIVDGNLTRAQPVLALGHEGAGTVMEIGSAVRRLVVGDRVVLSAVPSCGLCWFCSRAEPYLCEQGAILRRPPFLDGDTPVAGASGLGTFSDVLVVDEHATVAVHTDQPAEHLAMIGSAVLTGVGAAVNIAEVRAGQSVLVIGAGGVGLAAIQGAVAQGALPVACVDTSVAARSAASSSGATHVYAPGEEANDALRSLTAGRGFDVVIDCVGLTATFADAWALTRRGGLIVMVGVLANQAIPISLVEIALTGRRIAGSVYGSSSVHRDIPRYVAMADAGKLDLAALLGRTIHLDQAPPILLGHDPHPGRTVILPMA